MSHKKNKYPVTLHWHDFYEMDMLLSGEGITTCNGRTYEMKRGTVSLMSPSDFHEYKRCQDWELINIQFLDSEIDDALLQQFIHSKNRVIQVDEETLTSMVALSKLLGTVDSEKYKAEFDKRIIESLLISFLKCCTAKAGYSIDSESIQKAVLYINAHFRENPKMSEVAQMLHLCDSYFCRLFKKCVGMGYKEYLKKQKLEYGYTLIKSTELPLTEIASNCGYESQSHFNREFKKFFNVTPSSLR